MSATPTQTLAADLLNRLDALILDAERQTKPLELEPYRSELFELFRLAFGIENQCIEAIQKIGGESLRWCGGHVEWLTGFVFGRITEQTRQVPASLRSL